MQVPISTYDGQLVTLTKVRNAQVAELISNALDAKGIPCYLDGEHQGGFAGVLEIGIVVRESDLEAAQQGASG